MLRDFYSKTLDNNARALSHPVFFSPYFNNVYAPTYIKKSDNFRVQIKKFES